MSINKQELVRRISERVGRSSQVIEEILDASLEEIYQCLKQGESVNLRNFGSFYIQFKRSSTVFKFNPDQRRSKLFGWSSTYKGEI